MKFRNFLIYFILSGFLFSQEIQTKYIQNNEVLPQNLKKMSFSFSDIRFGKTGDFDSVIIDGCDTGEIGGYSIPYKVFSFEIEGEFSVSYVEVKNIEKVEIEKEINLARKEIDESVGGFIPGKFVDSGSSNYRGKTLIVVKIYPFQYNPETKRALFLKKGEVEIYYGEISKNEEKEIKTNYTIQRTAIPISEECIIITPQRYLPYAQRLKNLHEKQDENQPSIRTPVSTRIFTTEEIASLNYGGTNQPPLANLPDSLCPDGGYASRTGTDYPNRENILARRYNDTLARKILSFLLDLADAPGYENSPDFDYYGDGYFTGRNVQHILILGNASDVPPSYYFHSAIWRIPKDSYNAWIPTDYFYACAGKNGLTSLNPYYSVGRIPVSDIDQILYSGLIVSSVDATNRRITANLQNQPQDDLTGKVVIMRTGNATGRQLDISSWAWANGVLTLNFQPTAKMDNISQGDRFDIVDTQFKLQEMDRIVTKLENWVNSINNNQSYFKNISFAGNEDYRTFVKWLGSPSTIASGLTASLYDNELKSLEVINSIDKVEEGGDGNSYVSGLVVKKYFQSNIDPNGNKITNQPYAYLKDDIEKALKNEVDHENGIFYFSGDGGTDRLYLYDGTITSDDILNYPVSTNNNIFICQAPNSAKYDREIWNPPDVNVNFSLGIASLLSGSSSIGFFGPVRETLYRFEWSIDEKGILNYTFHYENEITKLFVKHYHRAKGGKVKIADILTNAQREFWTKNQSNWLPTYKTVPSPIVCPG